MSSPWVPGEFSTQTCFQGRFGEEVGSDQFGGCIMFHAPRPDENLAIGRIEHVEVRKQQQQQQQCLVSTMNPVDFD